MVRKTIPTPAAEQVADDFTQIRGIGPAVNNRLHQVGVLYYEQLASMKPKMLAVMLNDLVGFTDERITSQDWIGQAKRFAIEAGIQIDEGLPQDFEESTNQDIGGNSHQRQHYAMFNVKLLLDSANQVRYTQVIHAGTEHNVTWPGWDLEKLESFFVEAGQLRLRATREGKEGARQILEAELSPEEASGRWPKSRGAPPQERQLIHGILEIQEVRLMDREGERLGATISADQSFVAMLNLDLNQVQIPPDGVLSYQVDLYVRLEGNHDRQIVSSDEGSFLPEESTAIKIDCQPLSPGNYNLEVLATVWPHSQTRSLRNQLVAVSEGLRIFCC